MRPPKNIKKNEVFLFLLPIYWQMRYHQILVWSQQQPFVKMNAQSQIHYKHNKNSTKSSDP
jgi:hypothetical protein